MIHNEIGYIRKSRNNEGKRLSILRNFPQPITGIWRSNLYRFEFQLQSIRCVGTAITFYFRCTAIDSPMKCVRL